MTALLEPDAPPQDTAEAPAAPVWSPAPDAVPVVDPAPATGRPSRIRTLLAYLPLLTPTGVRVLGGVLVVLFAAMVLVEPSPDGPQPVPVLSAWDETLLTVQSLAMFAALAGFVAGRRWALRPALLFAGFCAWGVAMCPASGHHVLAGWWIGQVAMSAAMVLLPAVALLRTRARR